MLKIQPIQMKNYIEIEHNKKYIKYIVYFRKIWYYNNTI